MVSRLETQELDVGQPSESSPVPPKTVYVLRSFKEREEVTFVTALERKDGTGAPRESVERLPAAKIYC
jgi:hypothetical protein